MVGAVVAATFGALEMRLALRGRQPLLDVRLFADPNFATGVTAIVILFGATFGFFYIGMHYVQQIMGYSALAAVGFGCMYGLGLHPTYLQFAWPTLILAAGVGICTAPTTSAIMAAVPDEKQGVASAVNDTSREMGGALDIAVAGSILAGRYSHELAPRLAGFPAPVRGQATDSLAKAVEIAGGLGPQGRQLADVSKSAFLAARCGGCCRITERTPRRGARSSRSWRAAPGW